MYIYILLYVEFTNITYDPLCDVGDFSTATSNIKARQGKAT